jgi:hypothetical protein
MKYLTISYFILLFLYILEMIDNHRLKKLIKEFLEEDR